MGIWVDCVEKTYSSLVSPRADSVAFSAASSTCSVESSVGVSISSLDSSIAESKESSTFFFFFLAAAFWSSISISKPVSLEARRTFWPCLPMAIDC